MAHIVSEDPVRPRGSSQVSPAPGGRRTIQGVKLAISVLNRKDGNALRNVLFSTIKPFAILAPWRFDSTSPR
jgi:hypothetical protein